MGNLSEVEKGVKSVTIPGEFGIVVVPLDAKLSPVQNAQRYFEKAKKSRFAYSQSRKRLVEIHATLRTADDLLTSAEAIHSKEDLKGFLAEKAEELDKFGIGKKAEEREQLPFRIFTVDGGFEVWAGKSSRNNDELTMKHSKPNDLWFHARGASGSHVILKTNTGNGEPGKKAREQAAGIAAYYSKMKNARMVPVAMTERKYVRKPKGSPPGTVVLEREKVIFAEPALPEG
jgi:predicted ribosome quality control (RQC) complex YloA/Tae2 family protein